MMSSEVHIATNVDLKDGIVSTLAYFAVFDHPLTADEILELSPATEYTAFSVSLILNRLVSEGIVTEKNGFYFLGKDNQQVERRKQANIYAKKRMRAAWFHAGIIARFPFVRGVLISGSLSKGVMKRKDDIDFFIITEPGRLWVVRVLLTLFKRIFLLNSYRNFCLNYFIDTDHLSIPEKNIFTATEVGLILPMYNGELYTRFLESNAWYRSYYPHLQPLFSYRNMPERPVIGLIERLLKRPLGDSLDDFCMNLTRRFLARKYREMNRERFHSDLVVEKGVSKHHPNRQQFRILERYFEISGRIRSQMIQNV
jgi:hypothetical protein